MSTNRYGVPYSRVLKESRFRGRRNTGKLEQNRVWAYGKVRSQYMLSYKDKGGLIIQKDNCDDLKYSENV